MKISQIFNTLKILSNFVLQNVPATVVPLAKINAQNENTDNFKLLYIIRDDS